MRDAALPISANVDATVRLAAAGDHAAFARLVDAHHASMAKVAYVICGDLEAANDAVQVAWATAWRRLGGLRDTGQVRAWLIAIAANEARQALRRGRRARVVDLSEGLAGTVASDPADGIALVDLERALQRLNPDDRWLLALRFTGGLDSAQIAAQAGISASGVRSRLERLLDRLRKDLDRA
jgi:RNA polymerase sigma-70 factor (ECF subfamily)